LNPSEIERNCWVRTLQINHQDLRSSLGLSSPTCWVPPTSRPDHSYMIHGCKTYHSEKVCFTTILILIFVFGGGGASREGGSIGLGSLTERFFLGWRQRNVGRASFRSRCNNKERMFEAALISLSHVIRHSLFVQRPIA